MVNRRTFLKGSLAAAATLAAPTFALADKKEADKQKKGNSTIKGPAREDVFHIGMAGYTFNRFDIDTTLAFMKKIDVHYLCIKDFHLPLDADAQKIADFKAKLAAHDVVGYGVGPIYMKDVAAVDRAFAYAQRVGVDPSSSVFQASGATRLRTTKC